MSIEFGALRRGDMRPILEWRNQNLEAWRTPHALTMRDQKKWFRRFVQRARPQTYWAIRENGKLIGQSEISGIIWPYGIGEIGLLIDPDKRGKGYGHKALQCTLFRAFDMIVGLGLDTVFGEVYYCNEARGFWEWEFKRMGGYMTRLLDRKIWKGQSFDSTYFSIDAATWRAYAS